MPRSVLCVAIQLVEIEIGKQLTCQVAERDPDTRPPWARVDNGIQSSLSVRSQWMWRRKIVSQRRA